MSDLIEQDGQYMNFTSEPWVILSPIEQSIKAKIEKYGTPLKNWNVNIYRGILTGCNEAFIIDEAKKNELIAKDPNSAQIIRRLKNVRLMANIITQNEQKINIHLLSYGLKSKKRMSCLEK